MKTIEIKGVSAWYSKKAGPIFTNFSYLFSENEIYGLYGHNGCGKTTLLDLVGNVFQGNANGEIVFHGFSLNPQIGYCSANKKIDETVSLKENAIFFSKLLNLKYQDERLKELCQLFFIDENLKINKMSQGMKQKCSIIISFLFDFDVLLFDEALIFLDEDSMKNFFLEINKCKKNKIIILAEHDKTKVFDNCDGVIMLEKYK